MSFPGIADAAFIRGDVPMTKQEIRILALTKAHIGVSDTIIDIGAGTGSISVESALLAPGGQVFAIEREAAALALIRANAERFATTNLLSVAGTAPEALTKLPLADVIFVGGSGGRLTEILQGALAHLKEAGRLVVMAVTVETVYDALHIMEQQSGFVVEAFTVQINRIRPIAAVHMLQAQNQVTIIVCTRGGPHAG
jgi:cobalt-precorrin-6B (C15)-methyltransferase